MRLSSPLPFALLAACLAPSAALAAGAAPATAPVLHPLVSFHPRPWQPPGAPAVSRPLAGMIEGADVFPAPTDPNNPGRSRAEALKNVVIETRADGSRHAVLGGAIRAWTVASVDAQGQLHLDCASSEAGAIAKIKANAGTPVSRASSTRTTAPSAHGEK